MTVRRELLEEAADLVDGDRNAAYGDPRQDFQRTASMWSAYLGIEVKPQDVAALMIMLKCSRIRWSPDRKDSWVDVAGYAACGWHCVAPEPVPHPDGLIVCGYCPLPHDQTPGCYDVKPASADAS